jgi:alpha-tubulin suppressor-like RCC1 family protein
MARALLAATAALSIPLVVEACSMHVGSSAKQQDESKYCLHESDCPPSNDPCVVSTCFEQTCMMVLAAANTVVAEQKPGDCRMRVCDGNGAIMEIADGVDAPPDDGNDCTDESCQEGAPQHEAREKGATCGKGGVCNGKGKCGECLPEAARCEGTKLVTCDAEGKWQRAACPAGKPVCSRKACIGLTQVAAGGAHTCARIADGTVWCFGANAPGRLGRQGASLVPSLMGAVELALGGAHTCARLGDGTVTCWGANGAGQLGAPASDPRPAPLPVAGLSGVTRVAAGAEHTCVLVAGGLVKCWGRNDLGQLGDGAPVKGKKPPESAPPARGPSGGAPAPVAGLIDVRAMWLGDRHACALLSGGRAACWGDDESSQLGAGGLGGPPPPPGKAVFKPAEVKGLKDATDLALGAHHGCALVAGGAARCWGKNDRGQLGDGTTEMRPAPVEVRGLSGALAIALGAEHGCALLEGGTVRCWGRNDRGQLGDGTTEPRTAPVEVKGLEGVRAIAAGGAHTCALLEDGTLRCWGENTSGEVGDGTTEPCSSPAPVAW